MYNGIGLQTPRGSGMSGHIQASKFLVKPRPSSSSTAGGLPAGLGMRKPNKDILEHDRRRQVELRLLVLRDALEERGYTEGEMEERVEEARKDAEIGEAAEECRSPLSGEGFPDMQSHHVAGRKEKQLETLKAALGLDDEDAHKKVGVESDLEPGEIVPGKCSDEELDTDGQKFSKASKDGEKHAKKGKPEAENDGWSRIQSSRKSKHEYDSDADHDHDTRRRRRHEFRLFSVT